VNGYRFVLHVVPPPVRKPGHSRRIGFLIRGWTNEQRKQFKFEGITLIVFQTPSHRAHGAGAGFLNRSNVVQS
jgi:hypothetical protein